MASSVQFTLNFDDGSLLDVSPNSVLVFLDETGDEQLNDPKYPLFGFGGCCILARDYYDIIDKPWLKMKHEKFDLTSNSLHATGSNFTSDQLSALNIFFLSNTFGRFATIASKNSNVDTRLKLEQIVYYSFYFRVCEIIKWYEFENIIIIYEDSIRLKPKLEKYAADIKFAEKVNGVDVSIDTHYCVLKKNNAFSGLEVADFIIHSAGTTLRDVISGKKSKLTDRKDFRNIFGGIDSKYSSFMQINSATVTPKE